MFYNTDGLTTTQQTVLLCIPRHTAVGKDKRYLCLQGVAWVNDFCLGRYWPEVGPQVTLYVPRGVLHQGTNTLLLLEQEAAPCLTPDTCHATLQDTHIIDGPTPL